MEKRKIFFISLGGLSIVSIAALSITLPLVLKKHQNPEYLFENRTFTNKEEIFEYLYQTSKRTNYTFNNNKFIIDNEVFDNKDDFKKYVENNFSIASLKAQRNSKDFLINVSGELSGLIESDKEEKNIEVFKTLNGNAVLNKEEALESYINSYNENYLIDGQLFESLYNAQNYYKETKTKQLEVKWEK